MTTAQTLALLECVYRALMMIAKHIKGLQEELHAA